jgi:hypothetical protein
MGFFKELFGNWGGGKSRDDLARGRALAMGEIDAGKSGALDEYGQAEGYFDQYLGDYAKGGRQGYDAYLATLGLGDPALRDKITAGYFSDPTNNAIMDRLTNQTLRSRIGNVTSGATQRSLTGAMLDRWGQFQDRLRGVGEGGAQISGAIAGGRAGVRTGMGDIRFGAGQQRAGLETSYSNAIAASRNTGINNLFKIAGLGVETAKAVAPGGKK